jgi:hypothetical protein
VSQNENGDGSGAGRDGTDGQGPETEDLFARFRPPKHFPPKPPGVASPEQMLMGCGIGCGMLLLSLLVWGFIYWYNEPAFH